MWKRRSCPNFFSNCEGLRLLSGAEAELLCNLSGLLSYSRLEASILHLLPRGIKEKADGIQPRVRWVEIDRKGLISKKKCSINEASKHKQRAKRALEKKSAVKLVIDFECKQRSAWHAGQLTKSVFELKSKQKLSTPVSFQSQLFYHKVKTSACRSSYKVSCWIKM